MKVRFALGILSLAASLPSLTAAADQNDLQIYKLGDASGDFSATSNAAARFRMLGNELGVSLTGATLEPPGTVGEDGFSFTFEYSFAFINGGDQIGGQPYWVTQSPSPGLLMLPALHFRKGLPYSIEIGGRIQTLTNSSLFAGTVEVRWGIIEGFRYLPDLGARFSMTRLFGQADMDLTTGEVSAGLGKEFGIGGLATLTPYLGYGMIGVDSSSRVFLANQDTETPGLYSSNPAGGQALFAENTVGNNLYNRFYVGLRLRANIVSLTIEYSYDWAQSGDNLPTVMSGTTTQSAPPLQQLGLSAGITL